VTSREALALAVVAIPAIGALVVAVAPRRMISQIAGVTAILAAAAAFTLAAIALSAPDATVETAWLLIDPAAGVLVGVIGAVGLASTLLSPNYLATVLRGIVRPPRLPRFYYALLLAFWAVLAGVPLIGNLGGAWLLVEATTAASALLVGFSGKPRALEAGWKYLILTSLGLGVALLGIVLLAATAGGGLDGLSWKAPASPRRSAGRRFTTGCPTPTRKHRRPSQRCFPQRCCRLCCSSPGGQAARSRPPSAPALHTRC